MKERKREGVKIEGEKAKMVKEHSLETLVQDLENELKIKGWISNVSVLDFKNI